MSRSFSIISNFAAALAFAVPATAQAPVGASVPSSPDVSSAGAQVTASPKSPAPTRPVDRTQLRHQIYVMEGALARAVEFGAQSLNREMRSVMPDVFMLAGNAQARGVYLDGYGIFFDVQVPILRQSMMWSLRMMLDKDEAGVKIALDQLRQVAQKAVDPRERATAESAIKRLELQLNPMTAGNPGTDWSSLGRAEAAEGVAPVATPGPTALGMPTPPERPAPLPVDKMWVQDPNRAYTEAVQRAIIDAMIDYSAPMIIGADDWLTVAARDNEPRDTLAPQDSMEETVTLLYQVKGVDLAAYRSGTIDREETRRRVVVREF
ncbi:MAG: hypothetical protein ABR606_12410 [Vicinamibacterales bacterium]